MGQAATETTPGGALSQGFEAETSEAAADITPANRRAPAPVIRFTG